MSAALRTPFLRASGAYRLPGPQPPGYGAVAEVARNAGERAREALGDFADALGRAFQAVADRLSEEEPAELIRARAAHRSFDRRGGGRGGPVDLVEDLRRAASATREQALDPGGGTDLGTPPARRAVEPRQTRLDAECNSVGVLYDLSTAGPLQNCNGAVVPDAQYQTFYATWPACESCSAGFDDKALACRAQCCDAVNTTRDSTVCRCPADYSGFQCETKRPWSCALELLSPDLRCSAPGARVGVDVYGDPTCFKFSRRDDAARLVFRATCATQGPTTGGGDQEAGFSYYLRTDKLALTDDPKMKAVSRPFNFYRMSDTSGAANAEMPREAYTGDAVLEFTFNLSALTARPRSFFPGGRVYVETGMGRDQRLLLRKWTL